jgi:hypothetical protein
MEVFGSKLFLEVYVLRYPADFFATQLVLVVN